MLGDGKKKLPLMIILLFAMSSLFIGCAEKEGDGDNNVDDRGDNDVVFLMYYSTSSAENVTFEITLITNGTEVFNQTVTPIPGHDIYREKASGFEYWIKAKCYNDVNEISFLPNSQNSLKMGYVNGNIGLQEITD